MAGAHRTSVILCAVVTVAMALLIGAAGPSRADDAGLPGVSLTTTSGAPLQNGGIYGIGAVVVAHFDAPVETEVRRSRSSWCPLAAGVRRLALGGQQDRALASSAVLRTGNVVVRRTAPDTFTIGASHVSIADDATKQVSVYDGGALVRTMPTSMGRGGTEKVGNTTSVSGLSRASTRCWTRATRWSWTPRRSACP